MTGDRSRVVECGSGNVFHDLALPDPELRLEMAKSLSILKRLLSGRPHEADKLFQRHGIDSERRKAIEKGRLGHTSLEELRSLLHDIAHDKKG